MNAKQLAALNQVMVTLSRITNNGMGHNSSQRVNSESWRMMDEDPRTVEPSCYPFLKSGKIVMEFGAGDPDDLTVTDVVTITVNDGEWGAEFSKPAKKARATRKPKQGAEALTSERKTRKPMSEATKKAAAEKRRATIAAKKQA